MSHVTAGETSAVSPPRFMRVESNPALPPDLEAALVERLTKDSSGLREVRQAAFDALKKSGLPHGDSEEFTFIRTGDFLPFLSSVKILSDAETPVYLPSVKEIEALVFPECRDNFVVLVDGVFFPDLSRYGKAFKIHSLESILRAESFPHPPDSAPVEEGIRERLLQAVKEETDAAASLAMLCATQPVLIGLVPETDAASSATIAPLQILRYQTAVSSRNLRHDSWLVFRGGRHSRGQILTRYAGPGWRGGEGKPGGDMINAQQSVFLEAGAAWKFLEAGPMADEDIHFHKLSARLDRDSRLDALTASTGTRLSRNAYAIDLQGEGAEVEINGAAVLSGARQTYQFAQVSHLVPHGTSRQRFKTVAADSSKVGVDGTIFVAPGAQQTNAAQLIHTLMLSDHARANAKPRLMIHADDVKCSHGATMGKLDPTQQFYLESRGLSSIEARSLLTRAYIAEIINGIEQRGFASHLNRMLLDTLSRPPAEPANSAEATLKEGPSA